MQKKSKRAQKKGCLKANEANSNLRSIILLFFQQKTMFRIQDNILLVRPRTLFTSFYSFLLSPLLSIKVLYSNSALVALALTSTTQYVLYKQLAPRY